VLYGFVIGVVARSRTFRQDVEAVAGVVLTGLGLRLVVDR
jgi:hypothetical protein